MNVFHISEIVQMVPNGAMHHIWEQHAVSGLKL